MKKLTFEEICNLKVGDIITEYCYDTITSRVISMPIITLDNSSFLNHNLTQVKFISVNIKNGEEIEYLFTKELMHYGSDLWG